MARINLLPWRAEQRERKNKEFLTLVAMIVLLAGAAAFATWFAFNRELETQKMANQLITTENAKLDEALKEIESLEKRREDIISRMKVIQDLQGKRPIPVRVWDDMAKAIPTAMYLTEMSRSNNNITLKGKADNPNVVSVLIKQLDDSEWLGGSAVRSITKGTEKQITNNANDVIYPEENYVEFEVSTTIQATTKKAVVDGADTASGGK